MVGHSEKFSRMRIFAARPGVFGGYLEQTLIAQALAKFPKECMNKCSDARGLSKTGFNFIYCCVE